MKGAIFANARPKGQENTSNDVDEEFVTLERLHEKGISTNTWAALIFILYLIIGLLFYCFSARHLSALDAIYLAVITFSTVGYGQ
jgi:hypothetical protein